MFIYLVKLLNPLNIYHCVWTLLIVSVQGGGVRKVHSEVNMRGQSAVDNHRAPRPAPGPAPGHAPRQPRQLPTFEETRQSLKESVRAGLTSGYCYRTTAHFIKNKS